MKKFVALFFVLIFIIINISSVFAVQTEGFCVSDDENVLENKGDTFQLDSAESTLKNYIGENTGNEEYVFKCFGFYKGYSICCGGYNSAKPYLKNARIGNYEFIMLYTQVVGNNETGLYLISEDTVMSVADMYSSGAICDSDMDEIIKVIISNSDYKKYFDIYNIDNFFVGELNGCSIYYEGSVKLKLNGKYNCYYGAEKMEFGRCSINVYGIKSYFQDSKNYRGLYVIDNYGQEYSLCDAYRKGILGIEDGIMTLLNNQNFKDYWKIASGTTEITTTIAIVISPIIQPTTKAESVTQNTIKPTEPNAKKPKAENPEISMQKATVKAGKTLKLSVRNAKVKLWKSSNNKVATVKNGKVTAVDKGTAKITATLSNNTKLVCVVSVVSSPKLEKRSLVISRRKSKSVEIYGKVPSIKNTYKDTSYARIMSVRNAAKIKIKGIKRGTTTLKIKVNKVKTLKLKVVVK